MQEESSAQRQRAVVAIALALACSCAVVVVMDYGSGESEQLSAAAHHPEYVMGADGAYSPSDTTEPVMAESPSSGCKAAVKNGVKVDTAKIQKAHHTSLFKSPGRVLHVRRGASFQISVDVSQLKQHCSSSDALAMELRPSGAKGGVIPAKLSGRTATFKIPVSAPVGAYWMWLKGVHKLLLVNVLFNPWNKHDAVFLPSKYLLGEHMEQTSAGVCTGNKCSSPIVWAYDQFTPSAIAAATRLLEEMPLEHRSNAAKVARHLAWKTNSKVLKGKWRGSFKAGTDPRDWTGSAEILKKFVKNKKQVKYGQCWVFAGVLSTMLRAIGIPTRVVSAERAAIEHAKPLRARARRFWTLGAKGHQYHLDTKKSDGMWYYHVWVDAWMSRPDLNKASTIGWQALDATPQKWAITRKGQPMVLGPASVKRIKHLGAKLAQGAFDTKSKCRKASTGGKVCPRDSAKFKKHLVSYDEAFITSEVNADKLQYLRAKHGAKYKLHAYVRDSYAPRVMTQKPHMARGTLIDVACDYKANCGHTKNIPVPTFPADISAPADVVFSLEELPSSTKFGEPVTLRLHARLAAHVKPHTSRTLHVTFKGSTTADRGNNFDIVGAHMMDLCSETRTVSLTNEKPEAIVSHKVPAEMYRKLLLSRGHDSLAFAVSSHVDETKQMFAAMDASLATKMTLPPVKMSIYVSHKSYNMHVGATWRNPHKAKVCGCTMKAHLIGTEQTQTYPIGCVGPRETVRHNFHFHEKDHEMQSTISANGVVTCSKGVHASGFPKPCLVDQKGALQPGWATRHHRNRHTTQPKWRSYPNHPKCRGSPRSERSERL